MLRVHWNHSDCKKESLESNYVGATLQHAPESLNGRMEGFGLAVTRAAPRVVSPASMIGYNCTCIMFYIAMLLPP
jgi:hypothetical protein